MGYKIGHIRQLHLDPLAVAKKRTTPRGVNDAAPTPGAPTPERLSHGVIERLKRAIADDSGAPALPFRAVDTLAMMERRGSITATMRAAGEDFRGRFSTACLDPLRAASLERLSQRRGAKSAAPGHNIETARQAVWSTISAIGGLASPAGSVLWHVVGLEQTLKQWALVQHGWCGRAIDQEAASGILIAALGMLEKHYDSRY